MPRPLPLDVSMPIADPLALVDATLLFLIQVVRAPTR